MTQTALDSEYEWNLIRKLSYSEGGKYCKNTVSLCSQNREMEAKILEEIQKHYKQDVIDFDWEPVRKNPKRYGILYPIIGYIVSLLAVIFMGLGVFMWLFLIGGSILFFGGIYCANGIIREYRKIRGLSETPKHP